MLISAAVFEACFSRPSRPAERRAYNTSVRSGGGQPPCALCRIRRRWPCRRSRGKGILADPYWPYHAAQALGRKAPQSVLPVQYGYWLKRG
jgi:hypothetical protein